MPEFPPPSEGHSDAILTSVGSEVVPEQEVRDMELILDLCESPFLSNSCPLEVNGQETQQVDSSWSHDGDMQGFGQLERRWVLWHDFMKEHDQLDTWLRLAEPARLRCEAGSRLVQLDSLTRRNRTLTRLFHGAMQARLLTAARDCGQRWDDVNAKLEYITTRLKSFQQSVCVNSDRYRLWMSFRDSFRGRGPLLPMSTWGLSGTPQLILDAPSPVTTQTRCILVPAQRLEGWLEHDHPSVLSPIEKKGAGLGRMESSGRHRLLTQRKVDQAWLRVQSPAPSERRTSRSKSVQTDGQCNMDGRHMDAPNKLHPHLNTHHPSPDPSHSPSHDLKAAPDWMKHQYRSDLQAGEEQPCCEGAERLHSEQSVTPSSRAPSSRLHPALLCLLLAAALALLACLIWFLLEPPSSFHLALRYVNGPPPT
ncbi:hypothetical protein F7725_020204 [Dissostichus mawsoni]|uniref:KASH domain-containing protein n=1 Tax=Dissostichus mawsoni TaxID=36200 RepID=A0A7J5YCI5_DISMA|nr:hypothetical protein F7725_020204 [Dissostichus mawsoni]